MGNITWKSGAFIAIAVLIIVSFSSVNFKTRQKTSFPNHKFKPYFEEMPLLNLSEKEKMNKCVLNTEADKKEGRNKFVDVHRSAHKYLTQNSLIIEVGGNIGEDAEFILKHFKPKQYIILEPVERLFMHLVKKFENNSAVIVYNFGLGKENMIHSVDLSGSHDEGTSVFNKKNLNKIGGDKLRIVNAREFFSNFGVDLFEVDLITINCEGCEFDLLEIMTKTNLVQQFKHIQFQPHVALKGLKDPVMVYCRIQQLLSRTHIISYQYMYIWEMWRRKDIAM